MTRRDIEDLAFTRKYIDFLASDIAELTKSIAELQEHILTMEEKAEPQSPCTEDRPRSTSAVNKLDILVPAIADEKELLKERLELLSARKLLFEGTKNAYEKVINEAEEYIAKIDDHLIKLIIEFHCIQQLSWQETADAIGGKCNGDNLKMMFYRHFKREERETHNHSA